MTNIDYKKMYEEVIFDKITIQKEFELYKTNIQKEFEQYKITQNEINDKLIKENEDLKTILIMSLVIKGISCLLEYLCKIHNLKN